MLRALYLVAALGACGRLGFEAAPVAGRPPDAGDPDAAPGCGRGTTAETLARYTFDAALGADATGAHDAQVRGTVTPVPGRCGQAARFATGHLLVPDAPAFDLDTGAIELHARLARLDAAANQTLIARDGDGLGSDGHVLILVNPSGVLIARIQRGGASYYRCGPVVPVGTWFHVGLAFGGAAGEGLRLWLDHGEATAPSAELDTGPIDCTVPYAGGIAGNANAFVIGASNAKSVDGAPEPIVDQHLADADLDEVWLHATWRDFGVP